MKRRQFLWTAAGLASALASESKAADGLVDLELEARDNWVPLAGRQAYLSAFNSQVPGPAIEARPGDTVRIRFNNALSEDTNLHFHGLHIPPDGSADNSFLKVPAPGCRVLRSWPSRRADPPLNRIGKKLFRTPPNPYYLALHDEYEQR